MGAPAVRVTKPIQTQPSMSDPSDVQPAAGLPGAGVLDEQALSRLHELDPEGKAGLVARVLETYTRSLASLLAQLATARKAADVHGQRHVVHTLKSSSASVGALKLSEFCADIERRLREGPMEGLDGQLDDLRAEGERVLAALRGS